MTKSFKLMLSSFTMALTVALTSASIDTLSSMSLLQALQQSRGMRGKEQGPLRSGKWDVNVPNECRFVFNNSPRQQPMLPLIVSHGGVFKALGHYLGYKEISASNGMPFLCKPPSESSHSWFICSLCRDAAHPEWDK